MERVSGVKPDLPLENHSHGIQSMAWNSNKDYPLDQKTDKVLVFVKKTDN